MFQLLGWALVLNSVTVVSWANPLLLTSLAILAVMIPRHHDPHVCFHSMAIDLWGPIQQQAIGGFLYVLGAICFLSNYHLAELLKSKSDAPTAWRRMLLRIRALGYEVVTVRVDNDSVLLSKSFLVVCDEFGVCVDRSVPYRHHQMARIERHWRTMAEAVTALLENSGLALRFWGVAFLTYCGLC